jgi:hypothetical protein
MLAPVKPETVLQPAPSKPLPQATIKLQPAPAPASARVPHQSPIAASEEKKKSSNTAEEASSEEGSADEFPLPLAATAAILALAAVGIQVWALVS